MSTAVRERPASPATGNGGIPARRAVIRWGLRLFRHEWRQQLLVLALVTVAVAATILGAAISTSTPPPANAGFGTANHLVTLPGSDPRLAADIAAIRQQFGTVDVIENQNIATGTVGGIQLRAQNPAGPFGQPMLALVSGHFPVGPDQVAVTKPVASIYHLRIGSVWHQGGQARRVVGLVENPQNLLSAFALVAPGQLTAPAQVTVLFNTARARVTGFHFPAGATVQVPRAASAGGGLNPAVVVLSIAILGLIFIGLVAVAGFTVMAQRRLRALGMLAALGATDRNIRLVMVVNGAAVGLAGTLIGAVVGFGAWFAYAPSLATSTGHTINATHLPWLEIGIAMALAIVTATLAAQRPARAAARVPVVTALAGRPSPPKASRRRAAPGAVLLVIGTVLMALAGGWAGNSGADLLKLLGGLVAITVGGLLLTPVLVGRLGMAGRHSPVAVRIALRDLARYRARSGSALAAISFAVMLAALIAIIASARFSNVLDYTGPNLAPNELLLYNGCNGPNCDGGPPGAQSQAPQSQAPQSNSPQATLAAVGTALGSHNVVTLQTVGATLYHVQKSPNNNYSGTLYLATPALLRHYGIQPSQIRPGTVIITARPGLASVPGMRLDHGFGHVKGQGPDGPPPASIGNANPPCPRATCVASPKMQTISQLPSGTSDPNTLVTAAEAKALGLHPTTAGWIFQTAQPLTAQQINSARQLAATAGDSIETKSSQPSLAQLRNWATVGGVLLALGVLAMTVGLIRSETAGDLRTLTATGAGSTTRRSLTAATAGALALLGALLGVALAYLGCLAWLHSSITTAGAINLTDVPWTDLTVIIIGMPLVATVVGWLAAGRQPPAIARQPGS